MVEDTHSDYSMEAEEVKVNTQNDPMQNGSNQANFEDTGIIPIEAVVQEKNMEKEMMLDVNVTVTVEERQKSKEEEEEAEKANRESWDDYEEDEENESIFPYVMVFIILMVGSFMLYVFFSLTAAPQDVNSKDEESVDHEEEVFVSQKLEEEKEEKVFPVSKMTKENQKLMKIADSLNILREKNDKDAFRDSIKDLKVEEIMILESNETVIEERAKTFRLNVDQIKVIIREVKKTVIKKETVEETNTDMGNTESVKDYIKNNPEYKEVTDDKKRIDMIKNQFPEVNPDLITKILEEVQDELEEAKSKAEEELALKANEYLPKILPNFSKIYSDNYNKYHSKVKEAHTAYEKDCCKQWLHSFYCDRCKTENCCKTEYEKNMEAIRKEHDKVYGGLFDSEGEDEEFKKKFEKYLEKMNAISLMWKWHWRFCMALSGLLLAMIPFVYHFEMNPTYCNSGFIISLLGVLKLAFCTCYTSCYYAKYKNAAGM